jgi:hypothetical protein
MPYKNRISSGIQTSITGDPRMQAIDLSDRIYKQSYSNFPFLTIYNKARRGAKPKGFKCEFMTEYETPVTDVFKDPVWGSATGANYARFARFTPEQAWRDGNIKSNCIYYPGDMFSIQQSDQTVMVICTPDANRKHENGSDYLVPAAVSGVSTTKSLPGTIVVMNVSTEPLRHFTVSDVNMHGKGFSETESYNGMTRTNQVVYDCNYVQGLDAFFECSKDEWDWIQKTNSFAKVETQMASTIDDFKKKVENALMFSNRSWTVTDDGSALRTMNGVIPSIKTNISFWNPASITNRGFEKLLNELFSNKYFVMTLPDRVMIEISIVLQE